MARPAVDRRQFAAKSSASFSPTNKIGKHLLMIERQRRGFRRIENADFTSIVPGHRVTAGNCHKNDADGMSARVPVGLRITPEKRLETNVQAGLLARLAQRGVLDCLTDVDKPAGQSPAEGLVPALDKHNRSAWPIA
jgi:hypothetical protein